MKNDDDDDDGDDDDNDERERTELNCISLGKYLHKISSFKM